MSGMEIAAIIGAVTTLALGLLGLIGAAVKYIVSLILDAYKAQAKATTAAKDQEIHALNARIDRHVRDIEEARKREEADRGTIADLRQALREGPS